LNQERLLEEKKKSRPVVILSKDHKKRSIWATIAPGTTGKWVDDPPKKIALSRRGGFKGLSRFDLDQMRPHELKGLVIRLGLKLPPDEYDRIVKAMKERLTCYKVSFQMTLYSFMCSRCKSFLSSVLSFTSLDCIAATSTDKGNVL
jgi:mRNA-degrading endonuclease toxin of MazEF toxin-antitoxin module